MYQPQTPEGMNRAQKSLYEDYLENDPQGTELLGYHRGRPVIYTHTTPPRYQREGDAKRHVVVLLKNGQPGDLSENWEDGFAFDGQVSAPTVRAVIHDWLSWSVRA